MKKTIKLFAILAVLLFAASCQNKGLDGGQTLRPELSITATIAQPDASRVTYDVDNETTHTITPAWTVGDEIIGFDDADQTFTFTVDAVDGSGRAVLDLGGYTQGTATKLYAIYAPGKAESDLVGTGEATTLAVNLGTQNAVLDDDSPVLMCATAEITAGSATLAFENQTAIIGLTRFKLPVAATVTSIAVDGLVTTGTFSVEAGALVLTPGTTPATVSATGSWATGDGNICETALYFATLPTTAAKIALRANDGANDYGNLASIAATDIAAGNYYYMQKNLGDPVADVNGVKYGAIEDAFNAANLATSAVTLTLLADCTTSTRFNINASGTGAVTFDLNGYTLTISQQIRVTGRTLTITDSSSDVLAEQGTINCTYTGGRALYVAESSTLNYAGGTLKNSHTSQALYVISGSTVNMTGGKILAQNNAASYSTGTVTISGNAMIESLTSTAIYNNGGTLTVEGNARLTAGGSYGVNTDGENGKSYIRGNAVVNSVSGNAIYAQGGSLVEISGTPSGYSESGATIYAASGTINISGGNFGRGGDGNGYVVYTGNAAGRITVSGGTFYNTPASSVVRAYTSGSVITVTGGCFNSTGINPIDIYNGTVYVKGGCFNKPIQPAYAVDESSNVYVNVLNTDPATAGTYPFTLSPASSTPIVAVTTQSTNTWNHGTVESAFKCADQRAKSSGSAAVTMQEDDAAAATMTVNSGNSYRVTLDLNGHTVSSTASPAIAAADDFTLNDLASGGELVTTGATALSVTDGTVAINSGSLCGATNAVNVSGGTLNIYDGHIFGGGAADIVTTAGTIALSGGFYRYEPEVSWLADGYACAAASEVFKTRSYGYQIESSAVIATVDGANYGSWDAAVAAACSYSGDSPTIAIQLLEDVNTDVAINLAHATKPITLDMNGHTITVSVAAFLNCTNELTIFDTGSPKGKIISSEANVINKIGTGTITLDGCVIASTAAGSSWYSDGVVKVSNSASELIVRNGAIIYATQALAGLACRTGSATVTDSEISSGTESAGVPALNTGGSNSSLTINSGSFYSSASSRAVLVSGAGMAKSTSAGTTVINGGYFYASGGAVAIKGNYTGSDHMTKVTINGGYFCTTTVWSGNSPTYGSGKSEQSCSVNHTHETTGVEYTYTFKVDTTPEP